MAKKEVNKQDEKQLNSKLRKMYDTNQVETKDVGQMVEELRLLAYSGRRVFERRWYDNNFFDDGFHYRYLSRTTNKIVDLSERATIYTPQRAIPKASRQIRGVANLLVSQDPTPAVYPEEQQGEKSNAKPLQQQMQQMAPQGMPMQEGQPQQQQMPMMPEMEKPEDKSRTY